MNFWALAQTFSAVHAKLAHIAKQPQTLYIPPLVIKDWFRLFHGYLNIGIHSFYYKIKSSPHTYILHC